MGKNWEKYGGGHVKDWNEAKKAIFCIVCPEKSFAQIDCLNYVEKKLNFWKSNKKILKKFILTPTFLNLTNFF